MFGRKPKKIEITELPSATVSTIPEEFYGGASPQVVFSTSPIKKRILPRTPSLPRAPVAPPLAAPDKKALDKATAVGAGETKHPVNALSNQRTFLLILGVVFVLGILGGVAYYFILSPKRTPQPLPPVPVVTPTPEPTPTPVSEPTSTSENTNSNPTSTTTDNTQPFSIAPEGLSVSVDSDVDGLTDVEEDLFKTDSNVADSDHDEYPDSHEVFNLYNPIGKEPQKISDSGLVTPFINPTIGYELYRPNSWAVGNVDQDFEDVLFSTFTGEYVRVKTFTKDPNESFQNFLTRIAPNERVGNYVSFTSRFKEVGFRRTDYLAYVFLRGSIGLVISYEVPPESSIVNYPTVVKMMARSFSWQKNSGDIPLQVIESPTSTPVPTGL